MRRSNGPPNRFSVPDLRSVGLLLLSLLGSGLLVPPVVLAQRTAGTVNVGLQVGQPAGVTGKLYRSGDTAYAGLVTTDGDEFVNFYVYRHRERPLPDSLVHLYVGPGLLVGAKRLDEPAPIAELGVTGQAGLNFYEERFEVFLHVTPILRFLPKVEPALGGSVGLRYTFGRP